ncbi:unnamed protein product [Rotaria socialis]|uniref:Uncharacterized protein n=2 Tax=Rotaria socialis TaxID=392032 RepID=A0A817SH35_9BILA|nr:unnamed protein product [Rotaria socialis]CAF3422130.1 unnamed protein product [Rotaria socialis]CAF4305841.1 unnamed protein product [Rotaria socialis]CAF4550089.1 unnamed protein product [Rotaria socialis]
MGKILSLLVTEVYVRDPNFIIVLLTEANQELANCYGARTIKDLCTGQLNKGSGKPLRPDFKKSMLNIQTKFDLFMRERVNGTNANRDVQERLNEYGETHFVSMIYDARVMTDESFESNVEYIRNLPENEKKLVDKWINEELQKNANKPPTHYQQFNSKSYRELIGINPAREKIRSRWLQAFNKSLPSLKLQLVQLTEKAEKEFTEALNEYANSNPTQVRLCYLTFLNEYCRKLALYATYKSEIEVHFPHDRCSSTYEQIERDFMMNWQRRIPLRWRAYLTPDEIKTHAETEDANDMSLHELLDCKLIGSSQFDRLHKVFSYMVLAFKYERLTADEIITIESLLYGGLSCSANTEKLIRDALNFFIRKTFVVGVAWLTQMYSYLLGTFFKSIIKFLLSQERFKHLQDHIPFLSIIEVDYHQRVRAMMRKAIQAVRDARFAYSAYAHYDLTAWLMKLTFRISPEIRHNIYSEKIPDVYIKNVNHKNTNSQQEMEHKQATIGEVFEKIDPPKLLSFMFGSGQYLTSERDPKTGSHHPSARKIIDELYAGTCSKLVYDVAAHFNAHVVIGINQFDHVEPYSAQSIDHTLTSMKDTTISRIANIEIDDVNSRLKYLTELIGDLTVASRLVEGVAQQFQDGTGREWKDQIGKIERRAEDRRRAIISEHDERRRRLDPFGSRTSIICSGPGEEENNSSFLQGSDVENKYIRDILNSSGASMCNALLQNMYQCHDQEDLEAGLLEGDALDQDSRNPKCQNHLDPDDD